MVHYSVSTVETLNVCGLIILNILHIPYVDL